MICPNLDGSESPTYEEHNDRAGLDQRLAVLNCKEARARYLAALAEYEANDITLYMNKYELQSRLRHARSGVVPPLVYGFATRMQAAERREPRNEREAARAGFSCA